MSLKTMIYSILCFIGLSIGQKVLDEYMWPLIKRIPSSTTGIVHKFFDTLTKMADSALKPDEDIFYKNPTLFIFSRINEILSSLWRFLRAAIATVFYLSIKNHIEPKSFPDFVFFMLMAWTCVDSVVHFYYIIKRFDFLREFISSRYQCRREEMTRKDNYQDVCGYIDKKKVEDIFQGKDRF